MSPKLPFKLTWKTEIGDIKNPKSRKKKYLECTAWFQFEDSRENHIKRIKREGAKFIRKSMNKDDL